MRSWPRELLKRITLIRKKEDLWLKENQSHYFSAKPCISLYVLNPYMYISNQNIDSLFFANNKDLRLCRIFSKYSALFHYSIKYVDTIHLLNYIINKSTSVLIICYI